MDTRAKKMKNHICINCSKPTKLLFSKTDIHRKKYSYFECKKCQLIAISPFPNFKSLYKFSDPYSYFVSENPQAKFIDSIPFGKFVIQTYLNFFKNRVKIVDKLRKSGKILDIGCSNGGFLKNLNDKWQIWGLEINASQAKNVRSSLPKAKIYVNKIEDQKLPKNYFDVITLWHVFEHIQNPNLILKKIRYSLKKKGYLIIEVPNGQSLYRKIFAGNWQSLLTPEHLYFYSKKSLTDILIKNNFKIKTVNHFGILSPSAISSLANFLREIGLNSNLAILIGLVFSPIILIINLLSLNQRENLMIIAKK